MRLFLPIFMIVLLTGCANPAKLLEQGRYKQALEVSSRQLQNGRIKAHELAALETSFLLLTREDSIRIEQLRNAGRPSVWPEIYRLANRMDDRQNRLLALRKHLARNGYFPDLSFYPAAALKAEAARKSALFHYANAQEYLPRARQGDRLSARQAYEELSHSLAYVDHFKDAAALQLEMRDLGTTHLLLRPGIAPYNGYFMEPEFLHALLWGHRFPEQEGWLVIHDTPSSAPVIHFELDFYLDDLSVSSDREVISSCSSSKEIEDGFQIKKVWSEKDSAYVEIKETVYKTVSATVTTVEQSKEAEAALQLILYAPQTGDIYREDRIYGSEDWSNTYVKVSGDDRALSSSCPSIGGLWCAYPSDLSLLEDAVEDMRMRFWLEVSAVEDY